MRIDSLLKFEESVEVIDIECSKMGETGQEAELPVFLLCPMLALGSVDCHDKDVSFEEGSSPVTVIGELWQHWLTSNQLPSCWEGLVTVLHDQLAFFISPCCQYPLPNNTKRG